MTGNLTNPDYTVIVGGPVRVKVTPQVTTASSYTTGMVVGGLLSFAGAARAPQLGSVLPLASGLVQAAQVTVKTALTAPYDLILFDTNPSNSTFTDNAALAVNTADLPSICGVAHLTDAVSLGTPELLQTSGLALPFQLSSSTTLFGVLVIRGQQTFGSSTAIEVGISTLQN